MSDKELREETNETTEEKEVVTETKAEKKDEAEVVTKPEETAEKKSYENIKPTLWERMTTKQKVLSIAIPAGVIVLAVLITIIVVRTNHYKNLTQGVEVYYQDGTMKGVKAFKDAEYSYSAAAFVFAQEDADISSNPAVTTSDGKYIYFAEESANGVFSLYVSKVNGKKKTLVDDNVTDYEILEKGVICYAAENTLYRYVVKGGKVSNLATDATNFILNSRKNRVMMLGGGILSAMEIDKPGEKKEIDTGVSRVFAADDKFESFVYEKNGVLCGKYKEDPVVSIANNVNDVWVHNIDEKYEVYYIAGGHNLKYYKRGDKDSSLVKDYVTDIYGANQQSGVFLCYTQDGIYYFVENGKPVAVSEEAIVSVDRNVICDKADGKVTFIGYDASNKGTLYAMSNKLFNKGKIEALETDVVSIEFIEGKELCICKNDGTGIPELYLNGERIATNVIPGSVQKCADRDHIVYACNTFGTGKVNLFIHDGKEEKVIGEVADGKVIAVSGKAVYYVADVDGVKHFMKYNGKKSKSLAENVMEIGYIFY